MQDLGFDFGFYSYNAITTIILLGIIPIIYVLRVWWKAKDTIILSVMLGPLVAVEYLLSCLWFIATFPFWVWFQVISFVGTGHLLADGVWLIHTFLYIGFGVSFFVVPDWIRKAIEGFTEMYQATQNANVSRAPIEIKRRPYYAKIDETKMTDHPETENEEH